MLNGIAPPRMKDRGESRCMGPEAVLSPGRLWFFLHTGQTGGDGVCGRVRRVGLILLLPASCMQYYESGLVRRNACIRGPPPIALHYSKLLQNAFWLTRYPVDSTTGLRHAGAAAAQ